MTRPLVVVAAVLAIALCLIYVPDAGHGFIRDDFRWIDVGRIESAADIPRLFLADLGFYRPIVLASFSANYALFGLHAFPYALTNLAVLIACALAIARLATLLGLTPTAGLIAAAAWAFNPRAASMAILWISGRTALFLTLFALLAAIATLQRRRWAAALWCLLALLSKEEAVTLPFFLAAWIAWLAPAAARWRETIHRTWPLFLAVAVYTGLRSNSHAFGPFNAPEYYQFTFAPGHVLRNIGEYLDRSSTCPAAIALLLTIGCRRVPVFHEHDRKILALAAGWLVSGFAITLFLPVRSDLYSLAPSAGSCLALAVVTDALARRNALRVRRTAAALVLLPFLLLPVYRIRSNRWVQPADLSARALADLAQAARGQSLGSYVVLIDAASQETTLENAFESLITSAGRLIGIDRVEIVVPGTGIPTDATAVFRLVRGRLQQIPGAGPSLEKVP